MSNENPTKNQGLFLIATSHGKKTVTLAEGYIMGVNRDWPTLI